MMHEHSACDHIIHWYHHATIISINALSRAMIEYMLKWKIIILQLNRKKDYLDHRYRHPHRKYQLTFNIINIIIIITIVINVIIINSSNITG